MEEKDRAVISPTGVPGILSYIKHGAKIIAVFPISSNF
jgi:hypothetical protein